MKKKKKKKDDDVVCSLGGSVGWGRVEMVRVLFNFFFCIG